MREQCPTALKFTSYAGPNLRGLVLKSGCKEVGCVQKLPGNQGEDQRVTQRVPALD